MPSPFPGMDPYLEEPSIWPDLHLTLIVAMRAELNSRLPGGYLAAADRHVWIDDADEEVHERIRPDVHIVEMGSREAASDLELVKATMPRVVTLPIRERKGSPFLKIVDAHDRHVITVVELLSPANKTPGADRNAYLAKREEYLAAGVNLVEINLLRAGSPPPLGKPKLPGGTYYILVCRASELPKAERWTFTVRDSIPAFEVPLREGQGCGLNLRGCLDRAYDEARHGDEIDYTAPPQPGLSENDARWVAEWFQRKRHTGS